MAYKGPKGQDEKKFKPKNNVFFFDIFQGPSPLGVAARPPETIKKTKNVFFTIFRLDTLTPYKPPFNPINRPWDPSRSIELEKRFLMMV